MPPSTHKEPAGGQQNPAGVVVLGMHRSGTSVATRVLNLLGLKTCRADDLMPAGPSNPEGHWESWTMMAINDIVLGAKGATWWRPPRTPLRAETPALRALLPKAAALFDAVHPEGPWVWKDPRTCMTLPFWNRALARPLVHVLALREPIDVARSLEARNGMPLNTGLALWERYSRSAIASVAGRSVYVTRYRDLLAEPAQWAESAAEFLQNNGLYLQDHAASHHIRQAVQGSYRHHASSSASRAVLTAEQLALDEWLDAQVGSHSRFDGTDIPKVESPTTDFCLRQAEPPDGRGTTLSAYQILQRIHGSTSASGMGPRLSL